MLRRSGGNSSVAVVAVVSLVAGVWRYRMLHMPSNRAGSPHRNVGNSWALLEGAQAAMITRYRTLHKLSNQAGQRHGIADRLLVPVPVLVLVAAA